MVYKCTDCLQANPLWQVGKPGIRKKIPLSRLILCWQCLSHFLHLETWFVTEQRMAHFPFTSLSAHKDKCLQALLRGPIWMQRGSCLHVLCSASSGREVLGEAERSISEIFCNRILPFWCLKTLLLWLQQSLDYICIIWWYSGWFSSWYRQVQRCNIDCMFHFSVSFLYVYSYVCVCLYVVVGSSDSGHHWI